MCPGESPGNLGKSAVSALVGATGLAWALSFPGLPGPVEVEWEADAGLRLRRLRRRGFG